jgi:type I restriction enzyme S subunit
VLLAEKMAFLRFASGTTHQTIYFPEVKAFHVCLPPIAVQREIAHVLSTLDDKIELNRRMSETLEAMARALFRSWFVDLDPVRAKAAELIAAGVLEIGDGYRAKNTELGSPGLPFIRAGDLSRGLDTSNADLLHLNSVARAGDKLSRPWDVLFASKGTIGRLVRVTKRTQPFVYSPQVCYWRSMNHDLLNPLVLYCWMQSKEFKAQVDAVAGQTDMAPYVSLRDQREMNVPVFPASQQLLARNLSSILWRKDLAVEESTVLTSLRDTLLPRLLTGELPLKNATLSL